MENFSKALKNLFNKLEKDFAIAGVIAILLIIIIAIVAIVNFTKNSAKSTADIGSYLNIKQSDLDYDFSIKVNSVKDTTIEQAFSDDSIYKVVNLTMTNNASIPNPIYVQYALVDSKGNEIATGSSLNVPISSSINAEENFDEDNLKNSNSISGNLYFATDSNDVQKLQIMVATKGLQSSDSDIEYYYINLK